MRGLTIFLFLNANRLLYSLVMEDTQAQDVSDGTDIPVEILTIGSIYLLSRTEISTLWISCGSLANFVTMCRQQDRDINLVRCRYCHARLPGPDAK